MAEKRGKTQPTKLSALLTQALLDERGVAGTAHMAVELKQLGNGVAAGLLFQELRRVHDRMASHRALPHDVNKCPHSPDPHYKDRKMQPSALIDQSTRIVVAV